MAAEEYIRYPGQRPLEPQASFNPWIIRVPILLVLGGALFVLALAALLAGVQVAYAERIAPGTAALGMDLGGMTRAEAVAALDGRYTYPQATVFTFRDGERTWQFSAADLGVSFDAEATVDQALAASNGAVPLRNLLNRGRIWLNGASIAPVIHYDQSAATRHLLAIAAEIDQPARDASLTLDGSIVRTEPGQAGRQLDISATLAPLHEMLMTLSGGGELPLVVNEMLPLVWNAEAAAAQINAALSGPLELVADGPNGQPVGPWTISVEQIASLLSVQLVANEDGTRRYEPRIDMSAFEGYLRELAAGLIVLPQDARFRFDPNTRQLIVTSPAQSGRVLDVARTLDRLQDAVWRADNRRVPVAFDLQAPRYHDGITAAELGITEMVSESTTIYTGSTYERRHNIAVGAALYDGVIIGPGEEFSFNYFLGPVTPEAGFLESGIIQGERTVDGIGGGLCQVSTTVFRAALFGGFTIIERNSHAYRVGFYEINAGPGLDAAIWTPDRDFRFQNDTPYHLLIETSVFPSNNALQFRFYSTNPGRQVEIQDPIIRNVVEELPPRFEVNRNLQPGQSIQVDWSAKGADVTVIRIIRDLNGEEIRRDSIFTHYVPWRAIFQVAPGDSRASGNS